MANPTVCVRSQTSQLVTTVAVSAGQPRHEVYQRIYTRLTLLYGVDLARLPRHHGESLLSVAERYGHIDRVYTLACAEHLYQQQYEE